MSISGIGAIGGIGSLSAPQETQGQKRVTPVSSRSTGPDTVTLSAEALRLSQLSAKETNTDMEQVGSGENQSTARVRQSGTTEKMEGLAKRFQTAFKQAGLAMAPPVAFSVVNG